MRRLHTLATIAALGALLGSGCVDIPGLEPGDPCNSNGVCVEGLVCQEGVCVDNADIAWEQMSQPYSKSLYDVWGSGEKNVFAVGSSGKVLRFTGSWADGNQQTGVTGTLNAVWGRGPNEVWAVGSNAVIFFNGSVWSEQDVVKANNDPIKSFTLYDVHGDGNNVYAVGSYSTPLVLRHESGKWREVLNTNLTFTGKGVFVHKGRVWIVGNAAHVLNMTGGTWTQQNLPGAKDLPLSAIWGADAGSIVAVGPTKTLARFDNSAWRVEETARGSGTAHGIWGPSASEFYVAGTSSSTGGYNSDLRSGIEGCSTTCAINPVPEALRSKVLRGVWGTTDGKVIYAVGDSGAILRRSK
jgi:hypothetical protein